MFQFCWSALRYLWVYVIYVYGGKHLSQVLYGEHPRTEDMSWLWRTLYNRFLAIPKVVILSCMDARLCGPGEMVWHITLFHLFRRYGERDVIFFRAAGAGPSTTHNKNPMLAHAHRIEVIEGVKVAAPKHIVLAAHGHCAADSTPDHEKLSTMLLFASAIQGGCTSSTVHVCMLRPRILGWETSLNTHRGLHHVEHIPDEEFQVSSRSPVTAV